VADASGRVCVAIGLLPPWGCAGSVLHDSKIQI
jgi:hypothetical protein